MTSTAHSTQLRPNEGEFAYFRLPSNREVRIVQGCLTRELADGVIVPTNTALAVSGAAAAALNVIDNPLRFNNGILPELFPKLNIKDPIQVSQNKLMIDLANREKVGEIGAAAVSVPLSSLGIVVPQKWEHLIAAFVRHQNSGTEESDTLSGETIEGSLDHALQLCAQFKISSVVTVPFGTGLFGIPAQESAVHMMSVLKERLSSSENQFPRKVTVVAEHEGHFIAFMRQARRYFL